MAIVLLMGGSISVVFGLANIFSKRFHEKVGKQGPTPKYDINVFTPEQRYFIGRYIAGSKFSVLEQF